VIRIRADKYYCPKQLKMGTKIKMERMLQKQKKK